MLFKLDRDSIESSSRVDIKHPSDFGLVEKDIENFLGHYLHEAISADHLLLIGQERAFQKEADLLALDKKGLLYIFELKRWKLSSEDVLQVMKYCQIFGQYTYEQLKELAHKQKNLEDLKKAHQEHFHLAQALHEEDFNKDQVLVLVTSGTEESAISTVKFWQHKGVQIKLSPYRIYDIGGTPFIQFDTYSPYGEVFSELNTNYYMANTNKTYDASAWENMMGDYVRSKAAAYGGQKFAVKRISKGSTVYLYHTGQGVIAKGIATSGFQEQAIDGDADEEFYVPLKFEWALRREQWNKRAPKAWQMNQKWNTSHRFRNTVFSISEDMANGIDSIFKEMSP